MFENQKNIWKNITHLNQKSVSKEYFTKRIELINQIENEKTQTLNNSLESESKKINDKDIKFTKKKRGRKLNHPKENNIQTIHYSHRAVHDRNSDDNIKRKVKTHFHNYIIRLLNSKLKIKQGKEQLKFAKMKSEITQNITVEYNRNLFKKKIKDILIEVSDKYQNKNINSECIDYIMENRELNSSIVNLLNMTYEEMYLNYYLKSTKSDFDSEPNESYEFHKEKLRNKYGEEYLKKYIKNAEDLILFYNFGQKRNSKKEKDKKTLKLPLMIELDETKQNKNNNNNNNKSSYYLYEPKSNNKINFDEVEVLSNNAISRGTQTEMKQVDEESENEY